MSATPFLGRYHFEAWVRRGIGASLNNPDTGSLPTRASLNVQLFLNVQGGSGPNPVQPPATTVSLYGRGDVVAVDPRMVIRTEPRQFTVNFEPNYLCGIEFDTPDFPWLFTPAAPNGDRLHPGPLRNAAPGASCPRWQLPVIRRYVKSGPLARWIRPRIWAWRKCHVAEGSICELVEPPAA